MKPIRLSGHAHDNMQYRGASEEEVVETIRDAQWMPSRQEGRLECEKEFSYGREWNGRYYNAKQVRPIFVDEPDEIVVVTVYVYYC